ncbi:hypothetical protein NQ176_g8688 [Zarea fungicola]|uniref:Uncharacterized protein n=1 Tax=Zarea fungicola TaxID=93591 RepID=A0ACC1MS05_9HYPO|nr:hypothetical protein NQ176_g8688 [Lecanicillium fungicola]
MNRNWSVFFQTQLYALDSHGDQKAIEHAVKKIDIELLGIIIRFYDHWTEEARIEALRLSEGTGRTDLTNKLIVTVPGIDNTLRKVYSYAIEKLPTVDKSYFSRPDASECCTISEPLRRRRGALRRNWSTTCYNAVTRERYVRWTDNNLYVERRRARWNVVVKVSRSEFTREYKKLTPKNVVSSALLHHRLRYLFGRSTERGTDPNKETWTFTLFSQRKHKASAELWFKNWKCTWAVEFRGAAECSNLALDLIGCLLQDVGPMVNCRPRAIFDNMPTADRKQAFGLTAFQEKTSHFRSAANLSADTYLVKQYFQARWTCRLERRPFQRKRLQKRYWRFKKLKEPGGTSTVRKTAEINISMSPHTFFERLNATFHNAHIDDGEIFNEEIFDEEISDEEVSSNNSIDRMPDDTAQEMTLYYVEEVLRSGAKAELLESRATFTATMRSTTLSFSGKERAWLTLTKLLQWLLSDNVAHPCQYTPLGHCERDWYLCGMTTLSDISIY